VGAANDGVPETSVGAVSANAGVPGAGNVVVFMFAPTNPGTYMYHCHQEADIHVQMGMYGALVVYNKGDAAAATGPGSGKGGSLFGWSYDKDTVMLLSEIDTRQHGSEEVSADPAFNPVDYKPQYWFVNGLSFPNTIHVGLPGTHGWDDWIASHPGYDPFISGSVNRTHSNAAVPKGDKILLRMINMGFETQPMHMHGFHAKILGSDQRAWPWANQGNGTPWGRGMEKNTLTIGSGETYEWLLNMGLQSVTSTYPAATQTRYDPATGLPLSNTATASPEILDPGGEKYIGGPVVRGAVGIPTPGQLFPFHNHDDYKATNNGVYPGGQFTMIETLQ
jgi:FtsP/CotA-like multicopper oxidase with cupredoxin domain